MRFTAIFAALLALASPAAAFTSSNGFLVTAQDEQSFVVHYWSGQGETHYWCAAGEYVEQALHLSSQTRIYRATPEPRKPGQGILFTLIAEDATPGAGIRNFGAGVHDGSVSAGHASGSFCSLFDDFFFNTN